VISGFHLEVDSTAPFWVITQRVVVIVWIFIIKSWFMLLPFIQI